MPIGCSSPKHAGLRASRWAAVRGPVKSLWVDTYWEQEVGLQTSDKGVSTGPSIYRGRAVLCPPGLSTTSNLNRESGSPHPAHEALRMPEGVEGRDVVLQDGASAAATLGRKHVEVVLPTVGLAVLLMESWGCTGLGGAVRRQGYEAARTPCYSAQSPGWQQRLIPSGPKKAPHWAQKKCSGCHVRSRAVTTFCESQGAGGSGASGCHVYPPAPDSWVPLPGSRNDNCPPTHKGRSDIPSTDRDSHRPKEALVVVLVL